LINLQPLKAENTIGEDMIKNIVEQANLSYILPRTSLTPFVQKGVFTIHEHAYAYGAWKFAFQFLNRQASEFTELAVSLKNDPVASALLDRIKSNIRREAYTEGRVLDAIVAYPSVVKDLYKDFEQYNLPRGNGQTTPIFNNDLYTKIKKAVPSELDQQIFRAFLVFNQHVLKTNFYKPTKVAISFRLSPLFLQGSYPIVPFAVFLIVGAEFRGYHIRFRDIARGGIRIIKSANFQAFSQNVVTLFDENYNLAATQDRKNKDIPEGGSKGTILLSADHQDKAFTAFKKYIDSVS
jgi:glutamate dehydrogenase